MPVCMHRLLVNMVEYNKKYVDSVLYYWSVWTSGVKISEVLLYRDGIKSHEAHIYPTPLLPLPNETLSLISN